MWPNPQEAADLVTFTEEILNGKNFIFCAVKIILTIVILKGKHAELLNVWCWIIFKLTSVNYFWRDRFQEVLLKCKRNKISKKKDIWVLKRNAWKTFIILWSLCFGITINLCASFSWLCFNFPFWCLLMRHLKRGNEMEFWMEINLDLNQATVTIVETSLWKC